MVSRFLFIVIIIISSLTLLYSLGDPESVDNRIDFDDSNGAFANTQITYENTQALRDLAYETGESYRSLLGNIFEGSSSKESLDKLAGEHEVMQYNDWLDHHGFPPYDTYNYDEDYYGYYRNEERDREITEQIEMLWEWEEEFQEIEAQNDQKRIDDALLENEREALQRDIEARLESFREK